MASKMKVRENANENYTLLEMANLSWEMLKEEWNDRGPTQHFLSDFQQDVIKNSQITQDEMLVVLFVTVLFTIHRFVLTKLILRPISRYIGFSAKDDVKFSESSCKLFYYSLLYAFEYYLVIYKYPELRYDVTSHWADLTPTSKVPTDILALYLTEAGFYFHSIYATIFMDAWKKDSIAMLLHHVLANGLILFSLCFRYHRLGLIVLYLHDVADIFLESSKIILCLKNKYPNKVLEALSVVGFFGFTCAWFWSRLVLYPQIVLFSSGFVGRTMLPDANFYFLFNVMLCSLMCLNVWWFHFIVALVFRIATGQMKGVEDTREYDMETENGAPHHVTNGHAINGNGTKKHKTS